MKQAAAGAASATQAVKADKKPFFSQRTLSHFIDFLFVLPALILLGVFTYYPIVKLVQISFTDWNLLNDTWKYVGLKNWQWLFAGSGAKYLWNSLKVTFLYSMGEILVTMVGGMLLALLFNRMTRSFGLMRAFVFVPKYVANIDISYNRIIIDAKSILGILSMDLTRELTVRCYGESKRFNEVMAKFAVA